MSLHVGSKATVQNTSRADLNGQEVTIASALASNGRYTVTLSTGSSIALKPSNLVPLPSTGGGIPGLPPAVQQYVQQYVQQFTHLIQQFNTMVPSGYDPKLFLGGLVVVFFVFVYFVGFMRTALCLSVGSVLFRFGRTAYQQAGGGKNGVQAAAGAIGTSASSKIKQVTGFTVSSTQALLALGVVLFVVVRLSAPSSPTPTYQHRASSAEQGDEDLDDDDAAFFGVSKKLYTWEEVENAYKIGFNDVEKKENVQEGLEDYSKQHKKKEARPSTTGSSYSSAPPPMGRAGGGGGHAPSRSSGGFGGFGIGSMFTLLMLGNTVYSCGKHPATGSFDPSLVVPGLSALPKWRLGLNALMLLRLFGLSPI
jgi:hypothetical protein